MKKKRRETKRKEELNRADPVAALSSHARGQPVLHTSRNAHVLVHTQRKWGNTDHPRFLAIVYVLVLAPSSYPRFFRYTYAYTFPRRRVTPFDLIPFSSLHPFPCFPFSSPTLLLAIWSPLSYRLYPFSPFFFFVHCLLPSLKLDCRHYRHHHPSFSAFYHVTNFSLPT